MTEEEHASFANYIWYEKFKFCGCGRPEDVCAALIESAKAMRDYWAEQRENRTATWTDKDQERNDRWQARQREIWADPALVDLLVWYVLNAADLEEHGGSVPGWLTSDGEKFAQSAFSEDDE